MKPSTLILSGVIALSLIAPTQAQATEFGISDGAILEQGGFDKANQLGATWVRFQIRPGEEARYDDGIAQADARGMKIMISPLARKADTIKHAASLAKRYPQADAVTAYNEPEINGYKANPCAYKTDTIKLRKAVRKVRSHLTIIMGELSPHGSFEWLKRLAACKGQKLGLSDVGFHPYQWSTDPLSQKQLDSQDGKGDWLGIGRLGKVKQWLAKRSVQRAFGVRKAPRIHITEFGYLRGGGWATDAQIAHWWPRAIRQAERVGAKVIMAQGALTPYSAHRNWNSDLPLAAHRAIAQR
jgi:hypothetical protein